MSIKVVICYVCTICVISGSAFGQVRSSANYSITTDTIDSGGVNAASANYSLHGSAVGEVASADQDLTSSTNYTDKPDYVGQLSDMLDPITAVSRFIHGAAGTFDINLPVFGTRGIECRYGGSNGSYTVVFTFGNPLTSVGSVSASATGGGPAPGATGVIDNSDAHRYVVNLTNVPNAQYTTVALTNVMDSDANFSAALSTQMGVLVGDVDASGRVDSTDVFDIRQDSLQTTNSTNFREDIDASGRIDSNDVFVTRQNSLTSLPTPP